MRIIGLAGILLVGVICVNCGNPPTKIRTDEKEFSVQSVTERYVSNRWSRYQDGWFVELGDGNSSFQLYIPDCSTGFKETSLRGFKITLFKSLYSDGNVVFHVTSNPNSTSMDDVKNKILISACF